MSKKCLVVGGNGFIGKNLVLSLLQNQYNVVVFDIVTANIKEAEIKHDNIQYIEGDINNTTYLTEQIKDVNYVIWLIHTTVPATSMYDVEFDLLSNIPSLIRFVQHIIKEQRVEKFIFLSSGGTVYGNPVLKTPMIEPTEKNPISSYGLTKLIAEEYLTYLFKESSIKSFILRPSNVYGKYQNFKIPQGIIGHVFKSVILKEPINIYGDGSIVRDYIYVNDLAKSIIACLKTNKNVENPLILNIGSGVPTSINDIITRISEITGHNIPLKRLPERSFDCKYNVLSIEKANKMINWKPEISLQEGLNDVWEWVKTIYNYK